MDTENKFWNISNAIYNGMITSQMEKNQTPELQHRLSNLMQIQNVLKSKPSF